MRIDSAKMRRCGGLLLAACAFLLLALPLAQCLATTTNSRAGDTGSSAGRQQQNQGQQLVAVADLPRQPAVVCASDHVHAAFNPCDSPGTSAKCCSRLNSVYANISSPAYGCLCYPAVLYQTLLVADEHGLNVLEVLRNCQEQESNPGFSTFKVQWAGHKGSACPEQLSPQTRPLDVLTLLGSGHILPMDSDGGHRRQWAWRNLLQAQEFSTQSNYTATVSEYLFGKRLMEMSSLVLLALPLLFVFLHHCVLWPLSASYRKLELPQRLVTCQHAVYTLVFGASIVPQTVLAVRFLFGAWTGDILVARLWTTLVVFIMSRIALYIIECAVRAVKWSGVLVMHHTLSLTLFAVTMNSDNPPLGVIAVVLDLFTCHEVPLYAALLAYRLGSSPVLARRLLRCAVAWYVLTRILQTVMLGYIFGDVLRRQRLAVIGPLCLCVSLTLVQAYTLLIYRRIDRTLTTRITPSHTKTRLTWWQLLNSNCSCKSSG